MVHSQISKYKVEPTKFTALLFGEGGRDRKFINELIEVKQFKYRFDSKWAFLTDNATGGSPETILKKCKQASDNREYKLVICILDLDQLVLQFPKTYKKEMTRLSCAFPSISIFWNHNCLEDEIKKSITFEGKGKKKTNRLADKNINKFVNTKYWKRFINIIESREEELEQEIASAEKGF